jgi:hypothetical protein
MVMPAVIRRRLARLLPLAVVATAAVVPVTASSASAATFIRLSNFAANDQRCIGIANGWAGLWDCTKRDDQEWTLNSQVHDSTTRGYLFDGSFWHIENKKHECLSIDSHSSAPKARIRTWTCNNDRWEYWALVDSGILNTPPRNGTYYLLNLYSGLVIGVDRGDVSNGTNLIQYNQQLASEHPNQLWSMLL